MKKIIGNLTKFGKENLSIVEEMEAWVWICEACQDSKNDIKRNALKSYKRLTRTKGNCHDREKPGGYDHEKRVPVDNIARFELLL